MQQPKLTEHEQILSRLTHDLSIQNSQKNECFYTQQRKFCSTVFASLIGSPQFPIVDGRVETRLDQILEFEDEFLKKRKLELQLLTCPSSITK